MKVKEGDTIVCEDRECTVELKVTKACDSNSQGKPCEINATCCDQSMKVKQG